MLPSGKKCLQVYVFCLCVVVLVPLMYETVYLMRDEGPQNCVYRGSLCPLFDRENMCKNTNVSVQYGCSDPSCVERLSPASNLSYFLCLNKSWNPDVDERYINKGCCHFLNVRDGERESVLLASFPGSGNTWIRGLLERITGLCTGSIYCDMAIRRSGFIGENVTGPEVLVVKTHRKVPWMNDKPAVYIMRDPARALVSYWNFKSTPTHSHSRTQPQIMFGNNTDWVRYFNVAIKTWHRSVQQWTVNRPHDAPLHVLSYEDMVEETMSEMVKLMQFLRHPFRREELQTRLKNDFSLFQRHTPHMPIEYYYTSGQRQRLIDMMSSLHTQLREDGYSQAASIIQSYLNQRTNSDIG